MNLDTPAGPVLYLGPGVSVTFDGFPGARLPQPPGRTW